MVHECAWTWIPHLWDKLICSLRIRKCGFAMRELPEEICIDILSRLPGDCVLECRRVCKQWLELTSTPHFVEMHLKRATPVLLMQILSDVFILNEGAEANKVFKKMDIKLNHLEAPLELHLRGSCNGLLVFCQSFPSVSFVYNPLTGEKVTIRPPVQSCEVCGFFFHPILKDYRLLFMCRDRKGLPFRYSIYSLGSQLWRKLDDLSCEPEYPVRPIILNGALHWNESSTNSIMIFKIDTEEFHFMPNPGGECSLRGEERCGYIFERKGKLAFCYRNKSFIYVWVLKDYENWIWVKRYGVNLLVDMKCYPFYRDNQNPFIILLDMQDDELLFCWFLKGVYRYNLRHYTVKQIIGLAMEKMIHLRRICHHIGFTIPYTKTLVSPS